ncbi:stromal interaction molecule 1-like isoform X3 [Haliotis rufescens]|uniref:stromal interaction molecule 1-like isoform X3 n=1 Tax=Haliotis rufescens TaxID=6454 RepID=UPI00201F981E|nr:stromal interaction molecule 1-like isoform X3 [Haliotis rufescens]
MKNSSGVSSILKLTLVSFVWSWFVQVRSHDVLRSDRASTGTGPLDQIPSKSEEGSIVFECEELDTPCLKDKYGYDAIKALHHLLDDDQNGNVDQSESDEFLRDELQYTDGFERQKTFHGNDKLISVEDLWRGWKGSEVYNWTNDDVLEWLECHVELPQYIEIFHTKLVDGTSLPRLAYSNSNFYTTTLGIKNAVHKQKMSVKAMDAVLFGAPKKAHSYMKDIALVASLIIALGGCWFAYIHHHYSQNHVKKMMKDLECLQKAEEALQELQEKLEMAEEKQNSVSIEKQNLEAKYKDEIDSAKSRSMEGDISKEAERLKEARQGNNMEESLKLAEAELAQVRAALRRTEKELELQEHWSVPSELQAWLQLTHELEQVHYMAKRSAAEKQLSVAKEGCDKIRKRNKAFLGSLRMAHGNSLDDIDQRILIARQAFEEVKQDLQERLHRWQTIEELCGFIIMSNPGLPTLRQILQKDTGQGGRVGSSILGPVGVEEADEDLPPAYPTVVHSTVANGTGRPRALSVQVEHMSYNPSLSSLKSSSMKAPYSRTYNPSSQTKGSLPRLRSAASSGSTGSLSRVGIGNGSSRQSDSPSPSDHGSVGPVSFHLGEKTFFHSDYANGETMSAARSRWQLSLRLLAARKNSQHHHHHPHHHLLHHGGLNGHLLANSPISESPTGSVSEQINSLTRSFEDRAYTSKIPHSQSYHNSLSDSDSNISGMTQSLSTSALKKMAVNGDDSSRESSEDKDIVSADSDKKKRKKTSFFKMLRKGGNKTKAS